MALNIKKTIENLVREEAGDVSFAVERQETEGRGDYSTNVAFLLAKRAPRHESGAARPPLAIAEELASRLHEKHSDIFYAIEVAPPGFLNFYLSHRFLQKALGNFLASKKRKNLGKASVEFISANPTGPLHIGNARGGPLGDTIANILTERGWKVRREYFHNDAGAQIQRFAESLWYWYLRARRVRAHLPEGGYEGEYVRRAGRDACKKWKGALLKNSEKGKAVLVRFALERFTKENFAVMKKLHVKFDTITKESTLLKTKTRKVLAELEKKGLLKKRDGATWFTPSAIGGASSKDGKESVVIKSDGTPVYFANDIAYHKEKFARNDFVVDVLGEGHEGHIPKLYSVAEVFGFPKENFKIVVHGQVQLIKEGKPVTMSKRAGNFVTAEEVLREVGPDAFRYFMLEFAPRSGMSFDLTLARARSKQNPVYYIQYAHARAAGILRKSKIRPKFSRIDWSALESLQEASLIKHVLALEEVLEEIAHDFEVQRLARFSYELARAFTRFYETIPVIGTGNLEESRLGLVLLTKETLKRALALMGIHAPDKM